jgi:1-acyl-sn-glycerol-3-phosphate acyltransferase
MRTAVAVLRSLVLLLIQVALTVVFAIISLFTFPFGPLTRFRIISLWSRIMVVLVWHICGLRYRVLGLENLPGEPAIVLSKHQSAWETMAYQAVLPPHVWVLKRELLWIPFFGWGLAMMNPVAIDRGSPSRALRQTLQQGKERLAVGLWIVIFPEGTRTAPGRRVKYQVGGAWLACQTGAPVVPIAHNAGTVWRRNALVKYPGEVTISIGPVISPEGMKPAELIKKVEDWIEAEVERMGSACR